MSSIVDAMLAQHRALEKLFAEVDQALELKDQRGVSERLPKLRQILVAHVALEDSQFYPDLSKMAGEQKQVTLLEVATVFQKNMSFISSRFMAFFDQHEGKSIDREAFARDWEQLLQVIGQRMSAEEETLIPIFERLRWRASSGKRQGNPT